MVQKIPEDCSILSCVTFRLSAIALNISPQILSRGTFAQFGNFRQNGLLHVLEMVRDG